MQVDEGERRTKSTFYANSSHVYNVFKWWSLRSLRTSSRELYQVTKQTARNLVTCCYVDLHHNFLYRIFCAFMWTRTNVSSYGRRSLFKSVRPGIKYRTPDTIPPDHARGPLDTLRWSDVRGTSWLLYLISWLLYICRTEVCFVRVVNELYVLMPV